MEVYSKKTTLLRVPHGKKKKNKKKIVLDKPLKYIFVFVADRYQARLSSDRTLVNAHTLQFELSKHALIALKKKNETIMRLFLQLNLLQHF